MSTVRLFLKPCDVLLFRDGRPFGAGSEHTARSVFPPHPGTLYGAIRSALLTRHGIDLGAFAAGTLPDSPVLEALGRPDKPGTMAITGFSLLQRRDCRLESFLPAPADLVGFASERFLFQKPLSAPKADALLPSRAPAWLTHCWLPTSDHPGKGRLDLVPREAFIAALTGDSAGVAAAWGDRVPPAADAEFRTGIARDRSRRAVERGKLYTAEFRRMVQHGDPLAEVGFEVTLDGVDIPASLPWVRLGGDARAAGVERLADDPGPGTDLRRPPSQNRFKVVLLTPALFRQGWLPGWIDPDTGVGTWRGLGLRLVSVCAGKPVPVGGYDLVANRPKPMRRAVPAGSVLFFEVTAGDPSSLAGVPSISDERAPEGFGLFATGGFDYV